MVYKSLVCTLMNCIGSGFTYESVLADLGIKSLVVGNIKGNGSGVLNTLGEFLGVLKSTAG